MIRILQVLGSLNRGGAETMVMNLYRNIDRSRIQFDFVIHTNEKCDYEDEIISLGGKIYRAPNYKIYNYFNYKKWWEKFFQNNKEYRIIHGHQYSIASIYLSIAKKYNLKTIAHSHSTSNGKGLDARIKYLHQHLLYKIADYKFACSKEAGEWLYRKKSSFKIIKNAINSESFVYNSNLREKKRKYLKIEKDTFVVGHIGRFSYPKNHKFIINVFYEFNKKNPNSKLLLVGAGELFEEIGQQILSLNLEKSVILTGVQSNINELLMAMDVFLFPSHYEGLPVTLIEAQASGLPCLIADHITEEVDITNLIKRQSLSKSTDIWVDDVIQIKKIQRLDKRNDVLKSGYDIQNTAIELEKFYFTINS